MQIEYYKSYFLNCDLNDKNSSFAIFAGFDDRKFFRIYEPNHDAIIIGCT